MPDPSTPTIPFRGTIGVKEVHLRDVEHGVIFYDKNMYSGHVNRGGIWNFGDGEIAVAHLVNTECPYDHPKWVAHGYRMPTTGVMLHRSFDNGKTWPADEGRKWIWHNNRTDEEFKHWLRLTLADQRHRIDMASPDAIMHVNYGHYCNSPYANNPPVGFCLRSPDRGRTWEGTASLIMGPDGTGEPKLPVLAANLGYVRFDNGVLGLAGSVVGDNENNTMFFISCDNAMTWQPTGTIAVAHGGGRYTYAGVHRLPDGRLMCCMHKIPGNLPCVAFSRDSGNTWSPPQFIVGPESYNLDVNSGPSELPPGDWLWANPDDGPQYRKGFYENQRYRAPCALVLRDGRFVVVFNRRGDRATGGNGIHGVLSDDLGRTWSKEFMVWGEGYTTDNGYPVLTELQDGRIFTAYYATVKEQPEPVDFFRCVRHIRSTTFSL